MLQQGYEASLTRYGYGPSIMTYTLCPGNGSNSGFDYLAVCFSSRDSEVHSASPYRRDSHLNPLSGLSYRGLLVLITVFLDLILLIIR
jgi:hypothetical protein